MRYSKREPIYTGGTMLDKSLFPGCTCSETHIRWNYCDCGARQTYNEARANEIIPTLNENQIMAMTALKGAIPIRIANQYGRSLELLGLSTGFSRSGDNADTLTELGEVMQNVLKESTDEK